MTSPPDFYKSEALAQLHNQANEVLERNVKILKAAFPNREIIRVVTPPIITPDSEAAVADVLSLSDLPDFQAGDKSERLDLVAKQVADLMRKNPRRVTYRTFLNSVVLNSATTGKQVVIIPRFEGCAGYEPRVRDAYSKAFPHYDLEFVDADGIIHAFGAIHCITCTVPELNPKKQAAAK